MTRSVLICLALLATTGAGAHEPVRHPKPAATTVAPDPRLASVIAVADRFTAAIKGADFDTVRTLLDPHVLILESGGAERSLDEYMGHHAVEDAAFLGGATIRVLHRDGAVDGTTAWLATESEITPAAASGHGPMLSTETLVLRKAGDRWRIVHVHWSSRAKKPANR